MKEKLRALWQKGKSAGKTLLKFLLNPRFLLCVGAAWMVTNGWAYVLFWMGTVWKSRWMLAVSGAYLTLLWFPFTPEKIGTLFLAILFLKLFFPNDQKTLGVLKSFLEKEKEKIRVRKEKRKAKKEAKKKEKKKDR